MEIVTTAKKNRNEEVVSTTSYGRTEEGFVRLERGERHLLHPDLEVFNQIDCDFLFETSLKYFYISYDKNKNGEYERGILSKSKDTVLKLANQLVKG